MSTMRKVESDPMSATKKQPGLEPMTPAEIQLWQDLAWGASAPEAQQHVGKVVAVRNKRVVAVGTARQEVVQRASELENCPWWELAILVIPALDLSEIPR